MSGQSDWRRRRVAGGDQPNRPGQPPARLERTNEEAGNGRFLPLEDGGRGWD